MSQITHSPEVVYDTPPQTQQPSHESTQSQQQQQQSLSRDSSRDSFVDDSSSDSCKVGHSSVLRQESVIRSPQHQHQHQQHSITVQNNHQSSMPCFLSQPASVTPQNPFSKTTAISSSLTTTCSGTGFGNQSSEQRSTVILAPARLVTNTNSNAFSSQSSSQSKFMLRPSVLRVADSQNNSQNAQKDGKTFAFVSLSKEDITPPATTLYQHDIIRCGADTTSPFNGDEPPVSSTTASSTSSAMTTMSNDRLNLTSLTTIADSADNSDNSNSNPCFVFGENLQDRAVFVAKSKTEKVNSKLSDNNSGVNDGEYNSNNRLNAEGTSNSQDDAGYYGEASSDNYKTTPDGALDLSSNSDVSPEKNSENNNHSKRKFEVITGEEDEQNVLAMHCRLYHWDSQTSTWVERGRGSLRLNDVIKDDKLCSRIVMRTSGALRVILNTNLLAGMKFEVSHDSQCLRFTNIDGISLIRGATKDIDQLNAAIDYRLREIAKRLRPSSPENNQSLEEVSNDSCISNTTL